MASSMFITQCKSLGQSTQVCREKKGLVFVVIDKQRLLQDISDPFFKSLILIDFFTQKAVLAGSLGGATLRTGGNSGQHLETR